MPRRRALMKPAMALVALLLSACSGSPGEPGEGPVLPNPPTKIDGGDWDERAELIEPNSELALAEANGKLYLLGGYPESRQTARTVQVYDIASDDWELGP